MSLWRQLTRGLRVLTNRAASDEDLNEEARHYVDQTTEEYIARGLSADEARRAARLECGAVDSIREEVRDHGWENTVDTLFADLRFAARHLRSNPGFTVVAILTLALGIGATTAIFSAVNPILFESLPYPDPERVAMIWDGQDGAHDVTFGTYRELVERSRSFESIAVMRPLQLTLTGASEPERIDGQSVSADYFRVLGVRPALGRDFQESDDRPKAPIVVIICDALWHRRFGGDSTIVGRQFTIQDMPVTVIGVLPRGFENVLSPSAEIWSPLQYDTSLPLNGREWGHHLRMVGRLRPGVQLDQAGEELATIARTSLPEFPRPPWASLRDGFIASSLQADLTRGVRPALFAIVGAVILLLVISCVNVTNLLLARGARREGEFAVRVSLGAGRARLVRQLLTESLLLALVGGAFGVTMAIAGVRTLVALSPPGLPRVDSIAIDGSVLAFCLVITTLVGLAFGLFPALQAARHGLQSGLQQDSRRVAGGHRMTRSALVVAEVALAFVLLVGAGLLLRSMQRLIGVSPGFRPAHLLTMKVPTSGQRFRKPDAIYRFFADALDAARGVPGVTSAAFTSQLPMSGEFDSYGVHLELSPAQSPDIDRSAFRYAVTPSYFETVGIPLLRGRLLEEADRAGGLRVALVSESFAKRRFPGVDPIGQRVRIGPIDGPLYTIVGMVGDVKQMSLMRSEADAIYVTPTQWRFADNAMTLVVRVEGDTAEPAPALRQAVWSIDKDQPIVRIATMDELLALSAAERRFVMIVVTAFAVVALVLAAAGIYGVLSGGVAERIREIGVRSALGASPHRILGWIVGQGITLTLCGTAIGLMGSVAGSKAVATLLFSVSPLDLATYLGMLVLLLAVSGAACWLPARRASRVDPAITLKAE